MTDQRPSAELRPRPRPRHPAPSGPSTPGAPERHPADLRVAGGHSQGEAPSARHGGHRLMMVLCCIPMLVVVVALVVTGAAGSGAIAWALLCVAMMALMMFAMPGGHRH